MKRNTERIVTTHAGSLPRPQDLRQLMWNKIDGKPVGPRSLERRVAEAIEDVVERQLEIGIDVVSDGEMGKFGFSNYSSHEEYATAAVDALRHEYEAIGSAGFNLQLDAPDLPMAARSRSVGSDLTDFDWHLELSIEVLLDRLAGVVGKERLIAGTDCGFETFVGFRPCNSRAAWPKLEALVQGAALASERLW